MIGGHLYSEPTGASLRWFAEIGARALRIAEAMPEAKLAFKATPAQRTYREQILLVAGANNFLMKFLGGNAPAPVLSETDRSTFGLNAVSKAEVLDALSRSYDYGESVLKDLNDAALVRRSGDRRTSAS